VTRPAQHLDLVTLDHVDHPFPRRGAPRRLSYPERPKALRSGQNFRKRSGQSFRNPHAVTADRLQVASHVSIFMAFTLRQQHTLPIVSTWCRPCSRPLQPATLVHSGRAGRASWLFVRIGVHGLRRGLRSGADSPGIAEHQPRTQVEILVVSYRFCCRNIELQTDQFAGLLWVVSLDPSN